jgi:hypothetical protein
VRRSQVGQTDERKEGDRVLVRERAESSYAFQAAG